jgi:signal transduction histidine kinase
MMVASGLLASLPLTGSLAAIAASQALRNGRRRSALNEALHELRRPLQAIALACSGGPVVSEGLRSSVRMAAAALDRLELEINGGSAGARRSRVDARELLESAVARWSSRAALAEASLELRLSGGGASVHGDEAELGQALDNLIVNAIEHGGPSILVDARRRDEMLRVSVVDSGRASRPRSQRERPGQAISRLTGRRRRGHGLAVVRRVAAQHGGRFVLRRSEDGSLAVLELPLLAPGAERAA